MARKVKVIAVVQKITFSCNGEEFTKEPQELSFVGREQDCETCGSHGNVSVNVHCPICNNWHEIELNSW